jgi:hypothetical protein
MGTARRSLAGAGTNTAALGFGGFSNYTTDDVGNRTEFYNIGKICKNF